MNRRLRSDKVWVRVGVFSKMKLLGWGKRILLIGLCGGVLPAYAEQYEITSDQWARPRSGGRIIAFEPLQKLVRHLDEQASDVVVIRYAGGDEGLLWAEELRGWIIALGISGDRVRLHAGMPDRDRLLLETE